MNSRSPDPLSEVLTARPQTLPYFLNTCHDSCFKFGHFSFQNVKSSALIKAAELPRILLSLFDDYKQLLDEVFVISGIIKVEVRSLHRPSKKLRNYLKIKYNKTIIRFGFCDIWNNQGRSKCYQPKPKAEADNRDLDYSGYHKNRIY